MHCIVRASVYRRRGTNITGTSIFLLSVLCI